MCLATNDQYSRKTPKRFLKLSKWLWKKRHQFPEDIFEILVKSYNLKIFWWLNLEISKFTSVKKK
jgi:hypothetical protein